MSCAPSTDPNVPHPEETVDPLRDIETLQLEFTFNDLGQIEKRLVRLESQIQKVRGAEREQYEREQAALMQTACRARSRNAGARGGRWTRTMSACCAGSVS